MENESVSSQDKGPNKEQEPEEMPFAYSVSAGVAEGLEMLGATLLVSTYQAGKLCAFRARGGRLKLLPRTFDKAMGIAADPTRMAIATRYQIWSMPNESILAPKMKPHNTHDACYIPRSSHVTGNIDAHEIAWGNKDQLWIVNTHFSCLCTLQNNYSFVPRWRPSFVTELVRQDRCHVNGLAMLNGKPKYVTAFAQTNTPEGWREHKIGGGCLIDVPSNQIVAQGFSMPHSPRVYANKVWVLDSGHGRVSNVDVDTGKIEVVAQLPGYTRGLAFCGQYAFVGLSKIREKKIFGDAPIAQKNEERKCGVWILDIQTGKTLGFIEFQQTVNEIFDVQILQGIRFPAIIGLEKETIQRASVIGPEKDL